MNQAIEEPVHVSKSHGGCGAETGLISVDEALALIINTPQTVGIQSLPLSEALHRYLAEPVYSQIDLPLFSQSAVDGYAICSETDILAGSAFELVGEIRAGEAVHHKLAIGQAMRIFTGAQIPEYTTTVARQEIVHVEANRIRLTADLPLHADIRDIGEEISIGQCLAEKGQQLSVGAIAALSMAGIHDVMVYKHPKIAVVITGDEVAESVEDLKSGKIFDANAPLINAWFQTKHIPIETFHVADSEQTVTQLFDHLKDQYDLILTTGGVSVGDYDFVRPVALKLGFEQIFWKVKQKPGKPMFFAQHQQVDRTCYLLGLPGNPAAVYVGMQIYVSTLIKALQGQQTLVEWISAVIQHDLKADSRERFLRMSAEFEQGILQVNSLSKQQSHMLSNLMQANCLVRIPAHQNIQTGDVLQGCWIFD
nr:molybdopterin molybdotransferase MoeA [Acinetobacter shaoyimingii]